MSSAEDPPGIVEDLGPAPPAVARATRMSAVAGACLIAYCVGYTVVVTLHRPPLAAMARGDLLSPDQRITLMRSLGLWTVVTAFLVAALLRWARRRDAWPGDLGELVAGLWPLTLLPVALYAFDVGVWLASPVLLYAVTTAACVACGLITRWPPSREGTGISGTWRRLAPKVAVIVAIAAYVIYVSIHTILNHHSLGTAAYDLGLQENVLWNTVHGHLLYSSLMHSHYLGVHTSFVLLAIAPIYALVPRPETLLVLQTLAVAGAAWPLFLLARRLLASPTQAAVVALLWLTHPAVAGGNFYDFHPAALAPLAIFSAGHLWATERWLPFWIAVAAMLTVKEDMAIAVVLIGLVTLLGPQRRVGWALVAVGALAYFVLQHGVIPHFAGRDHSYAWYYGEMIPAGEGPRGLLVTAALNPIFTLKTALTPAKILYLFQLFAPLAFLPFATARGWILTSYGLASALLASRPALNQLGFHYALPVLALAFVGALLGLQRWRPPARERALVVAVLLAVVTCFHYGMIWPRHNFSGGFHRIDFDYTEADRARYDELRWLIERIPDDATVLASEDLVPHVAGRSFVETERYVAERAPVPYDVILIHNDDESRLLEVPSLGGFLGYEPVERGEHFVLYRRR